MKFAKNELLALISKGKISQAIENLNTALLQIKDEDLKNDIIMLSGNYEQLERSVRKGVISSQEANIERNKIAAGLIQVINLIDFNKNPTNLISKIEKKTGFWDFIQRTEIIVSVLAGLFAILGFFRFYGNDNNDSMQLTVYVQGENQQDIILQNTGKLVVDFDNDRRTAQIGENGRTNFGEIPTKFQNKDIGIGLITEGYELIEPNKKYKLDGKPIYLKVKRDQSLGRITGIVKNKDGSQFLKDALIMVDNDTFVKTDSMGVFKLFLPEKLHKPQYFLTIKKQGFQIKTEYYYPKSNNIEIRLEK